MADASSIATKVATSVLATTVVGPVAGSLVGLVGTTMLAAAATTAAVKAIEVLGAEGAKELFKNICENVLKRGEKQEFGLEAAYREALRRALEQMPSSAKSGRETWFANWERALRDGVSITLPELTEGKSATESLDDRFCRMLVLLDQQGRALQGRSISITSLPAELELPRDLRDSLLANLPPLLEASFGAIKNSGEYDQAWKDADDIVQVIQLRLAQETHTAVGEIRERVTVLPQVAEDAAVTRALVERLAEQLLVQAANEGRVTKEVLQAKDAELARMAETITKLRTELDARSSEPGAAAIKELLDAGRLDEAIGLKKEIVAKEQASADRLPSDLFELGTMYELQFNWRNAMEAYKKAWVQAPLFIYGFRYAFAAQNLNLFQQAIQTYEAICKLDSSPAELAGTLNNLALLYNGTKHQKDAEGAHKEALRIRRNLAASSPEVYLPDVAGTLNNLALLYVDTQRQKDAEEAYAEALQIFRYRAQSNPKAYLPDVAMTLNNLANLYRANQRIKEAETAYAEALQIRRNLATSSPEVHMPAIAATLNDMGILYSTTQRVQEAEVAYQEALRIRRGLSTFRPDVYLTFVAETLSNLGNLYRDAGRREEAEVAYNEALRIRRSLAVSSPEVHMPAIADTLNNLGFQYRLTGRSQEAEAAYEEALQIRRSLATSNPEVYLPHLATTLNDLAVLYIATGRSQKAEEAFEEVLQIRRSLAAFSPKAYLSYVATTLNNLANLYRNTKRKQEAERACSEAETILQPLWASNPALHGNSMARILAVKCNLMVDAGKSGTAICYEARKGWGAAYDPGLKAALQQIVQKYCGADAAQ